MNNSDSPNPYNSQSNSNTETFGLDLSESQLNQFV